MSMDLKRFIIQSRLFFGQNSLTHYFAKWILLNLLIGATIGTVSTFFLYSLDFVTNIRDNNFWLIALLPLAGFGIGLLYHCYGQEAIKGNALLFKTIHDPKQTIPFRMAPFVYLGTMATHLFGGSAGREGTALQMAGAIADQISVPLRLKASDRKILIMAAIAAGFGSVFGTPLAGAIFAIEIFFICKLWYQAIFPVISCSIIADFVAKLWQVKHTNYIIHIIPELSFLNLGYSIIAGLAFGVCALVFIFLMHNTTSIFSSNIPYPPLRPFVGGVLVVLAIWCIGSSQYCGLGIPVIVNSFNTNQEEHVFIIKILITILTVGSGFKGGEVTPLFFIGATLGSTIANYISLPIGLLAAMGFVAVFAGATKAPITCIIMAMELFGYECGIYVTVACVISYLISGKGSIYKTSNK